MCSDRCVRGVGCGDRCVRGCLFVVIGVFVEWGRGVEEWVGVCDCMGSYSRCGYLSSIGIAACGFVLLLY